MKKSLKILGLSLVVTLFTLSGCFLDDDPEYDEALIYGKWYCKSIGLYYTFNSNYNGRYEDINGDGKNFKWTLIGDAIEIEAKGDNINVNAYETYIITSLSVSKMECYDRLDPKEKLIFIKQ